MGVRTWWTEKSHRKKSHGNKVTEKSHRKKSHRNKGLKENTYNLYIHEVGYTFHVLSKK